jgi:hypothetical protein
MMEMRATSRLMRAPRNTIPAKSKWVRFLPPLAKAMRAKDNMTKKPTKEGRTWKYK